MDNFSSYGKKFWKHWRLLFVASFTENIQVKRYVLFLKFLTIFPQIFDVLAIDQMTVVLIKVRNNELKLFSSDIKQIGGETDEKYFNTWSSRI